MGLIRPILKSIFPEIFLKKCFLVYNKIKTRSWDRAFFPEEPIQRESFAILEKTNPFLDKHISLDKFPQRVQKRLQLWTDPQWSQDQYLLHYRKEGFIEPGTGWALTSSKHLIYPSLGFSRAPHVHRPDWVESYLRRPAVKTMGAIISLRDTGEENYFHFFNDVLPKLFFLKGNNVDLRKFTIVVSEKLFRKQYFQFYFQNTWLKDLSWHVQKNEWLHFEEAVFCKPYTHTKRYFETAVQFADAIPARVQHERIFITRPLKSLRFVENMDEIWPVLKDFGFTVIDTATLPFQEQVGLFQKCRHLVAVHGAGLVNMIFRKGEPLNVLEIVQPSSYIPFHYIMLAHQYGYRYDILEGRGGHRKQQGGFRVFPDELRSKIEEMVKSD